MKKPDLLILVAIWEFISAFIDLLILAAVIFFGFFVAVYRYNFVGGLDGMGHMGAIFGFSVAVIVLVIYIAISVAGGIGILGGREWGRILGIVQGALSLFSIPFGTVAGVLTLIYLTRTEVRDYFIRPVITITPPPPASPQNPAP